MIAYLEGKVLYTNSSYLILNVSGVGYKVFAVPSLLNQPIGQPLSLYIYHKSSDDGQSLFGLPTAASLSFFELLITVSGVGPKIALGILSSADTTVLQDAIARQDSAFFSQMGGIGKKTAERIIVELKDKVLSTSGDTPGGNTSSDIFEALVGLGYNTNETRRVLAEIDRNLPAEQQLKQALQLLSKKAGR
jgi:Holliday junction DNA helicase RuvA